MQVCRENWCYHFILLTLFIDGSINRLTRNLHFVRNEETVRKSLCAFACARPRSHDQWRWSVWLPKANRPNWQASNHARTGKAEKKKERKSRHSSLTIINHFTCKWDTPPPQEKQVRNAGDYAWDKPGLSFLSDRSPMDSENTKRNLNSKEKLIMIINFGCVCMMRGNRITSLFVVRAIRIRTQMFWKRNYAFGSVLMVAFPRASVKVEPQL